MCVYVLFKSEKEFPENSEYANVYTVNSIPVSCPLFGLTKSE